MLMLLYSFKVPFPCCLRLPGGRRQAGGRGRRRGAARRAAAAGGAVLLDFFPSLCLTRALLIHLELALAGWLIPESILIKYLDQGREIQILGVN